jgi:hypothetical protein
VDQDAAIQDFVNRLPYSQETLDLQAQAESVAAKLMGTEDPKEAEALQAELQSITQQMEADPAFAATKKALETIFEPKPVALESVERASGEITTRDVGLQGVWWGGLVPGDIMFQRDFAFPPASLLGRLYNHTGNYHGYGQVYESREGGAILKPLSDWQQGFKFVALGYNRWYPFAEPLLRQREAQYGMYGQTPFNFWFPNKWTDSALYCAQLTWKIHLLAGTNLDSNSWQHQLYVASVYGWWAVPLFAIDTVAPDEIADSPYVQIYSADWVIN